MLRRIAIIEDDPAIRANYAEALRKHGFEVEAYAGRAEALTAMRSRLPDLALIDIGLGADPDGGFELFVQDRSEDTTVQLTDTAVGESSASAVDMTGDGEHFAFSSPIDPLGEREESGGDIWKELDVEIELGQQTPREMLDVEGFHRI